MGQIPDRVLVGIGRQVVHRLAIGMGDIEGNDFATIFATAIEGEHMASPLGIADVVWNGNAWSVKTVQNGRPFTTKANLRFIMGRNSPDYSAGISDPRFNPDLTGRAVLAVWNARVNEALGYYSDLRMFAMLRNMQTREFVVFEEEVGRYAPEDFEWKVNTHRNLDGYSKTTGEKWFTWQPHGAQFSVYRRKPGSARGFVIRPNVPLVQPESILAYIHYSPDWIEVVG